MMGRRGQRLSERRTRICLPEAQHRAARDLARRKGVSLASVVREALDAYLAGPRSGGRAPREGDPILDLLGAFELPSLRRGENLDEAIDRSPSPPSTAGTRGIRERPGSGAASPAKGKRSSRPRSSSRRR